MNRLSNLQAEISKAPQNSKRITPYLMYLGYIEHFDDPNPIARAYAIESLFTKHKKHLYLNDLIAGSFLGALLLGAENSVKNSCTFSQKYCQSK